jgi:hypothetical protein
MFNREALLKATKEFFRVVVIAIIPILISSLSDDVFNWKVIVVTGAVAGLKFIDKLLHETGKELEESKATASPLTRGLTRF